MYSLEEYDYLEHVSSCLNSWITEKGEMYIKLYELFYKYNKNNSEYIQRGKYSFSKYLRGEL